MKKVIPILLTFLILLNSIGYILIYLDRLASNKLEIRTILKSDRYSSHLLKLKFTRLEYYRNLNWKEENEFEYKGEMYDVARIDINGNSVFIYCIRDEMEEQLIANFEKVTGTNSARDKIASSPRVLQTNLHLLAIQNEIFSFERINDGILYQGNYLNNYHSIRLKSPTPPPRSVS